MDDYEKMEEYDREPGFVGRYLFPQPEMIADGNLLDYDERGCMCRAFGTRTRFVLMPIVLLCLSFIWANILSFNLGVICLNNAAGDNHTDLNHGDHTHYITKNQQTYAISAMAAGALIGNFPVVFLVNRFGMRMVFGFLGLVSSAATLLMPLAIHGGYPWLIVTRVLQGVAFAANFPTIGAFSARWIYHKQSGLIISILVSYVQIAPIFSNPVGGALCDSMGWASIFYVHGIISTVLFIIYLFIFRNNPMKHPFVGPLEAEKVARGKPPGKASNQIPYKAILKTPAVWAIWIAAVGNFVIVNVFFVFSPTYLSEVLGFSVSKSGFAGMYPPLAQLITKVGTGLISDKIKFISETWKYRIFNTISFFGSAAVCVALAIMGDKNRDAVSPVMAVALATLGLNCGGFYKAAPTLSKQYGAFVTGYVSQCNCLVLLVIPFIVQAITPDSTVGQWMIVFFVVAGSLVATNIVFVFFIQGEPFEWTKADFGSNYPPAPPELQTSSKPSNPPSTISSIHPVKGTIHLRSPKLHCYSKQHVPKCPHGTTAFHVNATWERVVFVCRNDMYESHEITRRVPLPTECGR